MKGSYVKEGNIDIDPLFVDQSVGDYHLQFGSPCIDARNPNSFILEDKNGVARPQDGDGDDLAISDMGTYEYILTAKSDKLSCTGDLNEDVGITPLDALIAFQCYAGVGFCPKCADINQDGQVTVSDAFCIFQIYLGLANCLD
ncbi:MAG: choice-of-anchor Q domain-containing protein [bacterium]